MNSDRLNELLAEISQLARNDQQQRDEITALRAEVHQLKVTHAMLWENRMDDTAQ